MKTKLRPGWVLALLCTVLFFYGFYLGGVQLVISEVSREYGQNAAGMGGLVAAQHVAAVVLPVVLGALADRIGKKPVLCIFAAVFAAGCFLAGLSKNLGVYVIGAVCVGAGYSVCESVSSAVLSELDAEKGARYINLTQALLSLGADFDPAAPDARAEDYVKIYNALAQCAYNGGLSAAESLPGDLPCMLAQSTAVGGGLPSSLSASLAPLPEGGSDMRPAELLGIAVLHNENRNSDAAIAFIDWLCGRERLSKLALDSGLVPVSEPDSASDSPLLELYDCGKLSFSDTDGSAEREFDAQFRRTIELLN